MSDLKKKRTEEELNLIEETKRFMEEVNSDPEVANLVAPPEMKEKVFAKIRAKESVKPEKEQTEKRSAEEQELIRLGKIYKRNRRMRKYWVLAAAMVCALAFGMTSLGVPKKLFGRNKSELTGREQVNVDSDDISATENMSETEAYQEIEEAFGITPVHLDYLPDEVELMESVIYKQSQSATLIYGKGNVSKVLYTIRPNYRESSVGKDVEDKLLKEYTKENRDTTIHIRKFLVDEKEERWEVQFVYQDVTYFLYICDTEEQEVDKIVENLYFL